MWWIDPGTGTVVFASKAQATARALFGPYSSKQAAQAALATAQPSPNSPAPSSNTATASAFIAHLKALVGDQYVYGGDGPNVFDCSGIIQYAASLVGVTLPRTSEEQYQATERINANQLAPGDLVFSQWPGDNTSPGHVEIYIGNGQVLGAENPTAGVAIQPLSSDTGHIVGYGRIKGLTGQNQVTTATTTAATGNLIPGWLQGVFGIVPGGQGINELGALLDRANWIDWLERGALMIFGAILILIGIWKLTSSSGSSNAGPVKKKEKEAEEETKAPAQPEIETEAVEAAPVEEAAEVGAVAA